MRNFIVWGISAFALIWILASDAQAQHPAIPGCPPNSINTAVTCVWEMQPSTTYQGTLSVAAATSTALVAGGNVTMAPKSAALPTTFQNLWVQNVGTNPGYVCWFGGTASASAGCELLPASGSIGSSDKVNLLSGGAPSFFSTAGTTIAFHN